MSDLSTPELSPIQTPVSHPIPDPSPLVEKSKRMKLTETQIALIILGVITVAAILVWVIWAFTANKTTDVSASPSPSPIATSTPSPTEEPAPTPTVTPTPTPKPSITPKPTASPTPTPSPTASPSPTPQTKTITQGAGQDGYVSDFPASHNTTEIRVGRTPAETYRGFVGFDISEVPATATITKATLRLYQFAVQGEPYSTLGTISVDHLDYGTTLDNDDFNGGNVYQSSFGTIGSAQLAEWKTIDVTAQVKKDRSTHTSSQFRLHFATESHGGAVTGEFVTFSNPNASGTNDLPQLVVEFR